MASLWGLVVARQVLSRGFLALPRTRFGVLYSDTLSARVVGALPTPHGFVYYESPNGRWVGSPVGQYSFLVLRQSSPGTACPLPHQLVSAEPRALTVTHPLSHSPVSPHPDERHVYFVDSFIARTSQNNAQTKSLTLTPFGHTFSG